MWAVIGMVAALVSVCAIARLLLGPVWHRQSETGATGKRFSQGSGGHRRGRWLLPWIHTCSRVVYPLLSWQSRRRLARLLLRAGLQDRIDAEWLVGVQCMAGFLGGAGYVWLACLLWPGLETAMHVILAVLAALLAAAYPWLWLRDQVVRRQRLMARQLPFMLDMTVLCVTAGLNLAGALQQAAQRGLAGPLKEELKHALGDMRAGMSRQQALQAMADRTGTPGIQALVAALLQAETMGSGLGPVLEAQATQRRQERFLAAEQQALEAPVKMLLPLVLCIFPCTFLVLGFPVAVRLMQAYG